ncbi:MAG: type II toxin-antitoxin system RelE/ParE family toxin [Candidatus Aegiribacteria sp.]|nr:type II toxin-antitoxin system RelE/ParE family toxin [Candidatus Aegiribacteria sp.]
MQNRDKANLSEFRIFETDEFIKKLDKLSKSESSFVRRKLDIYAYPQIRSEPFYGKNIKQLKGYSPETWRYRIGSYRIFYVVDSVEQIIYMLTIDARKDAYRK